MLNATPKPDAVDTFLSGFQCVKDAGGFDGFIREVLAETKTTAIRRIRGEREAGEVTDTEVAQIVYDVVCDVMLRRIVADLKAMLMTKPLKSYQGDRQP